MSEATTRNLRSGEFLIDRATPEQVFVPEHFDQEDTMIGQTVEKFIREQVLPVKDRLDAQEEGLHKKLLAALGELGIFMADVPEEMDGLGVSKKATMRVAEKIGLASSFTPACVVQAGIGGLPIIYFGNDDQRARYLEGIMTGTMATAYALTEPGSGSDALAAKSTAVWDESKNAYMLNGTKQFITNAAFADIFIVFAKVDGEQFTCFICEKGMPGLSTGPEEHKMGLKGSSTRALILENVAVPKENVLGEIGKGHRIAFNVLNIGRLKLAPALLGGMKTSLEDGVKYATERHQFKKPIADFGLIKQKIAGATMRTYATESMLYRTADLIDEHIASAKSAGETDTPKATVAALKEFAVECSINKVYSSEALDWIADEMLQLHGGYGFIAEYPAEGAYRDARINRLWEGTSEVNRMLITGTLLSRSMKGELPLLGHIKKISEELMMRRGSEEIPDGLLGAESVLIENAKKISLFVAGAAAQKFMMTMQDQQEILAWCADMIIQTFVMESLYLRTKKLEGERDEAEMKARAAAVTMAVEEGFQLIEGRARSVLAATASGEELRSMMSMFKKLTRRESLNQVEASQTLAEFVTAKGVYPFE